MVQLQLWIENPRQQLTVEQAISRLEPPNNSKFSVIYSTYSLKENQVKFHLTF